uniref:Uncharacterized protein n=1 Tax=Arundo donax TaxID=35708 RepID=A0A0A9GIP4_ARUDO
MKLLEVKFHKCWTVHNQHFPSGDTDRSCLHFSICRTNVMVD